MKNQNVVSNIDWISVIIYISLVIMGWLNIYSSSLSSNVDSNALIDFSQIYGKQLLFIFLTIPLIFVLLSVDSKFYEKFSIIIFILLNFSSLFTSKYEVFFRLNNSTFFL